MNNMDSYKEAVEMMVKAGISGRDIFKITNLILNTAGSGYISRFAVINTIQSVEHPVPSPDKHLYDGMV